MKIWFCEEFFSETEYFELKPASSKNCLKIKSFEASGTFMNGSFSELISNISVESCSSFEKAKKIKEKSRAGKKKNFLIFSERIIFRKVFCFLRRLKYERNKAVKKKGKDNFKDCKKPFACKD